jgi:hypothetical protein
MPKFIAFIVVLAALAGGGYWYWTTTPQYSLIQAKDSFKNHDIVTFTKYVDIDSVSGDVVDFVVSKPVGALSDLGPVGKIFSFGLVSFVKPQIVDSVKQQVTNLVLQGGVNSSSATPKDQTIQPVANFSFSGDTPRKISLKNMIRDLGFRGKIYHGIAYVRTEGKVAFTGLNLMNRKYNRDFVLELRMHDMGGYWRIDQLSNLGEFVSEIYKLETNTRNHEAINRGGRRHASPLAGWKLALPGLLKHA